MMICDRCGHRNTGNDMQCQACGHSRMHYAPKIEQIRLRCRLIQQGWSEKVEKVRRGVDPDEQYEVPTPRQFPRGRRVLRDRHE